MTFQFKFLTLLLLNSVALAQTGLPSSPTDPNHPGSEIYNYQMRTYVLNCGDREVDVFAPVGRPGETFPVIVYGHGQALSVASYQATLEHLAKKGVIAIFPSYDDGFFDQDWTRMGADYVNLTACALQKIGAQASANQIVFSGHSKGAYVAGVAAGLAFQNKKSVTPKAVILFEPAGVDASSLAFLSPNTSLTVTFSDADSIVDEGISRSIYENSPSKYKQFISVKSYTTTTTALQADHFWPLTHASLFGGGPVGPLHYYGEWKWLGAAAFDLKAGGPFTNPYLYGNQAADKGVTGLADEIQRSF